MSAETPSRPAVSAQRRADKKRRLSAALPVEGALRAQGLTFGTDGSVGALYAYMRDRHDSVEPEKARSGDVLFFDLAGDGDGCGTHAGVVDMVDRDGRIIFREWRDGAARTSYVSPKAPQRRRDANGRVLNTFLRPKRPDDGAQTRYFAGEMLCAVMRASL